MSDALNPSAVDAALADPAVRTIPTDAVTISAAELVKLRQDAASSRDVEKATAGYVVGNELNAALASAAPTCVPGAAAKIAILIRGRA